LDEQDLISSLDEVEKLVYEYYKSRAKDGGEQAEEVEENIEEERNLGVATRDAALSSRKRGVSTARLMEEYMEGKKKEREEDNILREQERANDERREKERLKIEQDMAEKETSELREYRAKSLEQLARMADAFDKLVNHSMLPKKD